MELDRGTLVASCVAPNCPQATTVKGDALAADVGDGRLDSAGQRSSAVYDACRVYVPSLEEAERSDVVIRRHQPQTSRSRLDCGAAHTIHERTSDSTSLFQCLKGDALDTARKRSERDQATSLSVEFGDELRKLCRLDQLPEVSNAGRAPTSLQRSQLPVVIDRRELTNRWYRVSLVVG